MANKKKEIAEPMEQEATVTEVVKKPYTFRRLSTVDLFPMFKVISKLGLKQFQENGGIKTIISRIASGSKEINPTELGIDIFLEITFLVIENLPKCENELYALLSQTSDLSVEEIKAQDMSITAEMILDFIRKEEFGDFFKVVSKLFK
jgi:hypothetical protein